MIPEWSCFVLICHGHGVAGLMLILCEIMFNPRAPRAAFLPFLSVAACAVTQSGAQSLR